MKGGEALWLHARFVLMTCTDVARGERQDRFASTLVGEAGGSDPPSVKGPGVAGGNRVVPARPPLIVRQTGRGTT